MTRTERDRAVAEGLIKLADRVSEALANSENPHGERAQTSDLLEINSLVWELRWDIGLFAGEKELNAAEPEQESEAAE